MKRFILNQSTPLQFFFLSYQKYITWKNLNLTICVTCFIITISCENMAWDEDGSLFFEIQKLDLQGKKVTEGVSIEFIF